MATTKSVSNPRGVKTYGPPKPSNGKTAAIKSSKGKDKISNEQTLTIEAMSEQEALELNRIATEINQQLERIHEDMQDIIRDMRAMRGVAAK